MAAGDLLHRSPHILRRVHAALRRDILDLRELPVQNLPATLGILQPVRIERGNQTHNLVFVPRRHRLVELHLQVVQNRRAIVPNLLGTLRKNARFLLFPDFPEGRETPHGFLSEALGEVVGGLGSPFGVDFDVVQGLGQVLLDRTAQFRRQLLRSPIRPATGLQLGDLLSRHVPPALLDLPIRHHAVLLARCDVARVHRAVRGLVHLHAAVHAVVQNLPALQPRRHWPHLAVELRRSDHGRLVAFHVLPILGIAPHGELAALHAVQERLLLLADGLALLQPTADLLRFLRELVRNYGVGFIRHGVDGELTGVVFP